MRRTTFLRGATSVLTLVFAASWALAHVPESKGSQPKLLHTWAYRADNVDQMVRDVHVVAIARFVKTEPGRVIELSNGKVSLAFELSHFVVEQAFKGAPIGGALVVERTGSVQNGKMVTFADDDGGEFRADQRYLLFLRKQSDTDAYYQVNDEARYAIGADGRLETAARGKVAATLRGRSVTEASAALRQALGVR
jgi:hypothetical protein